MPPFFPLSSIRSKSSISAKSSPRSSNCLLRELSLSASKEMSVNPSKDQPFPLVSAFMVFFHDMKPRSLMASETERPGITSISAPRSIAAPKPFIKEPAVASSLISTPSEKSRRFLSEGESNSAPVSPFVLKSIKPAETFSLPLDSIDHLSSVICTFIFSTVISALTIPARTFTRAPTLRKSAT